MIWKPWEGYMVPFKLFGNIYFIGTRPASTHLIDTGDGLLILDSGYQESLYLVLENMRGLGFKPQDIRWIIHSHGHIDHSGATRALLEMFPHIKTYIGENDLDMVTGARDTSWARELNMVFNTFTPDVLIHDGDTLTFGNTTFECMASPGHTPGTFSYFWNAIGDDGRILRAGTMGGAGMNTLAAKYIHAEHLEDEDWRGHYGRTLDKCRKQHCDIFIGNHAVQNDTPGRYQRLVAGDKDAFVDSSAWMQAIDKFQHAYDNVIANDPL